MKKYIIIILFIIIPIISFGETITLQDGTVIKGKIISQDKNKVEIETLYGLNTINRLFIKSIEYENLTPVYDKPPTAPTPPKAVEIPSPPPKAVTPPPAPAPVAPVTPYVAPPPRVDYTYVPPKRNYKKNKDFFVLSFAMGIFGIKDDNDKNKDQSLVLLGASFKYFDYDDVFGFGMNIIGKTNKNLSYNDKYGLVDGKLSWTSFGTTLFIRYPESSVSPYFGIGMNINSLKFERNSEPTIQSYSYQFTVSDYTESKKKATLMGGHFDLGLDFYLSNVFCIDIGVRSYFLEKTDKEPFDKFKYFSSFYANFGFMF